MPKRGRVQESTPKKPHEKETNSTTIGGKKTPMYHLDPTPYQIFAPAKKPQQKRIPPWKELFGVKNWGIAFP